VGDGGGGFEFAFEDPAVFLDELEGLEAGAGSYGCVPFD
jgi:hypothetical protein